MCITLNIILKNQKSFYICIHTLISLKLIVYFLQESNFQDIKYDY